MSQEDPSVRYALLGATVKAVFAVGALSLLAAHWFSTGGLDRSALARLARGTPAVEDPTTTGSLARSAGAVRLDPCAAPRRP